MKKLAFLLPALFAGLLLAACGHCKTEDPRPTRTLTTSEGQTATAAATSTTSSCPMKSGM
jgi:uncharacterized lipoprotein YbaY